MWVVRTRSEGVALDQDVAIVGWDLDLSHVTNLEGLESLYRQKWPQAREEIVASRVPQLWAFLHEMREGEFVVMPRRSDGTFAVGRVIGPFRYRRDLPGPVRMTRPVQWLATDIPHSAFDADLLQSLEGGLVAIVFQIRRSNVDERVKAALERSGVPPSSEPITPAATAEPLQKDAVDLGGSDLELLAREQIREAIWRAFPGTDLATLLAGLLQAQGYRTTLFPEDEANAVDIVAQREPASVRRLLVRVATGTPTPGQEAGRKLDVTAIQDFQNAMRFRDAQQGILVAWRGFRENALVEVQHLPSMQLRDAENILDALLDQYEALPDDLQAAVPLKRIWALIQGE